MNPSQQLVTYLFTKGEPVSRTELMRYFSLDDAALTEAVSGAAEGLRALGLTLVDDGKEYELRSAPEMAALVEQIRKDEYGRDIGKAGIETLAIVLYKGPASRSEIDYIRGVNSSHILRSLAMRGLLRRVTHPKDERSFLYEPTTELLSHLGVGKRDELPEFTAVAAELASLENTPDEGAGDTSTHNTHES